MINIIITLIILNLFVFYYRNLMLFSLKGRIFSLMLPGFDFTG